MVTAAADYRAAPPDPLRQIIRCGPRKAIAAELLGRSDITHIDTERVHFPATRPIVLQLAVHCRGNQTENLFAEWIGAGAEGHADNERDRLRKSRRRQILGRGHGGILADPTTGLVLRRPGLDARLPGLRLLNSVDEAAQALGRLEGTTENAVEISLVAHRLGKRAVLRATTSDGRVRFLRLCAGASRAGRRAFDTHMSLWKALRNSSDLRIPEPIGFDGQLNTAFYAALPGQPAEFAGNAGPQACRSLCRAIGKLQDIGGLTVATHAPADELSILAGWSARVRRMFPELWRALPDRLDEVAQDLRSLPTTPLVLCHRDLHEKQLLIDGDSSGLLDFDTLRLGDPGLDPGNFQAHLCLMGLRTKRDVRSIELGILDGLPAVAPHRVAIWRRAALLRLAMIYAFTCEPRAIVHELIEAAA